MSIWWSLHLRREAASVPLARRLLLGTMETAGVDPHGSYDPSLPLPEACANAVEHGRGLGLIRELADHVHIGHKPGRAGTVVSFDKILKWRDDAPLMAV